MATVQRLVADIFERDPASLSEETRLMCDLPCESIDLLELGASLSREFRVPVDDEVVFLRSLRSLVADGVSPQRIALAYPHLSPERCAAIAEELARPDPVLCLGDIAAYVVAALKA